MRRRVEAMQIRAQQGSLGYFFSTPIIHHTLLYSNFAQIPFCKIRPVLLTCPLKGNHGHMRGGLCVATGRTLLTADSMYPSSS